MFCFDTSSSSMATRRNIFAEEQKELLLNLLALGFHIQSLELKHRCQFSEHMFDKPNKRAFEVVAHFLFRKLNPKQADELFRTCFPGTDKKSTQEFRKVCYNWLKRISEENSNFLLPKVNATLLMSPGGKEFVHLMFMFSRYVLYKLTTAMKPEGILLPPIIHPKHRNLVRAQSKTLSAMMIQDFNDNQLKMQLIKKCDEELQLFAQELVDDHHALQKKKKMLLQRRRQLADDARIYSEMKKAEIQKQKKRDLQAKIDMSRSMWKCVTDCVDDTQKHREIMDSVVGEKTNKYTIDGNKLQPAVPAKLLDECQEEIYQTIGTSLYEGGKINLVSLVSLGNLSLTLVTDLLHECGLPNFEKQGAFLKAQSKLCSDEMLKLYDIKRQFENETIDVKASIKKVECQLDEIYEDSMLPSSVDETTRREEMPSISTDVSCNESLETQSDCVQGLAQRYLLPSGNMERFLEKIVCSSDDDDADSPVETEVNHTLPPSQTWNIPAPAVARPSSARKALQSRDGGSGRSSPCTKFTLTQGKQRRVAFEDRLSAELRKHLASSLTPDGKKRFAKTPVKSRSKGRKSMSLPSSPLVHRHDDVIMERFTSRTPEADQKLIEQIVDCTIQDDHTSPLVVYQQDTHAQLNRSAFVSHDKIPRTPTDSFSISTQEDSLDVEVTEQWLDASDEESTSFAHPVCTDDSTTLEARVVRNKQTSALTDNTARESDDIIEENDLSVEGSSSLASTLKAGSHETPGGNDVAVTILPPVSPPFCLQDATVDNNTPTASFKLKKSFDYSGNTSRISHPSLLGHLQISDVSLQESSVSSSIDSALANIFEGDTTGILDVSTPGFDELESLDDFYNKVPVTNTLVSLDSEIVDVNANIAQYPLDSLEPNPIDLLMSTPPPLTNEDAVKENSISDSSSILSSSNYQKNLFDTISTPGRPMQEFQLNLLPTSDLADNLQTPELQRFKSLLNRKNVKK